MDSIFNSYLDLYTLKILIPSMILILFVLFLAGYGVAKLKMLMSIDHESVGYQQEAEYIAKRGRHLARYFIRAYVITVLDGSKTTSGTQPGASSEKHNA